jgi:hypothetical protein
VVKWAYFEFLIFKNSINNVLSSNNWGKSLIISYFLGYFKALELVLAISNSNLV